jgi:hypothetical protein
MVAKSQPHSLIPQNDNPKTAKNRDNLQNFRSHQLLKQRTKNPPSTINPTKKTLKKIKITAQTWVPVANERG